MSIAGSGNITANAAGSADVSIMGSGDVEVTGGARMQGVQGGIGQRPLRMIIRHPGLDPGSAFLPLGKRK